MDRRLLKEALLDDIFQEREIDQVTVEAPLSLRP